METVLLARQLSYGNRGRLRLSNLDLQLGPGDRLGLLGVNGAGKSTLMQLLAGVLAPAAGEVRLYGQPLHAAAPALRRHIGYLPQRIPAYPELTVRENLDWAARLRGLAAGELADAIDYALTQVQLTQFERRLAGRLSAGMLQRLGMAQAMLHRPAVLILDEPTAGLDPVQTEQIRSLLDQLDSETAMVLATHLLDDVQRLCDRVILLAAGQKKAEHAVGPTTDLHRHFHPREQATGPAA